jgi:hypothetical protein
MKTMSHQVEYSNKKKGIMKKKVEVVNLKSTAHCETTDLNR